MPSAEVYWRAKTIVERGHVTLLDSSSPPNHLHFQVKQRSGKLCDVFKTRTNGTVRWSCNAVADEKANHKQLHGCVVYATHIEPTPFCSHTKACQLWLDERGLTW